MRGSSVGYSEVGAVRTAGVQIEAGESVQVSDDGQLLFVLSPVDSGAVTLRVYLIGADADLPVMDIAAFSVEDSRGSVHFGYHYIRPDLFHYDSATRILSYAETDGVAFHSFDPVSKTFHRIDGPREFAVQISSGRIASGQTFDVTVDPFNQRLAWYDLAHLDAAPTTKSGTAWVQSAVIGSGIVGVEDHSPGGIYDHYWQSGEVFGHSDFVLFDPVTGVELSRLATDQRVLDMAVIQDSTGDSASDVWWTIEDEFSYFGRDLRRYRVDYADGTPTIVKDGEFDFRNFNLSSGRIRVSSDGQTAYLLGANVNPYDIYAVSIGPNGELPESLDDARHTFFGYNDAVGDIADAGGVVYTVYSHFINRLGFAQLRIEKLVPQPASGNSNEVFDLTQFDGLEPWRLCDRTPIQRLNDYRIGRFEQVLPFHEWRLVHAPQCDELWRQSGQRDHVAVSRQQLRRRQP